MENKDMYVCFRHQKKDGSVMYSCIQENKLWENMPGDDSDLIYFDMDDDNIEAIKNSNRRDFRF